MKQRGSDLRIALVDDHKLFRSGISALIEHFDGFKVLFEAATGQELINKITPKTIPDIVLLDIKMPDMNGFTSAEWLKKNHPDVKIIILSMYEDAEKVMAMLKLGVNGYLLKDAEPEQFEDALRKVARSEFFFPAFVTKYLLNNYNKQDARPKLNKRETEFLKLTGTELTYREIAEKMGVSARTVDGYRDQLFEKLNLKSRVGLVLYALKINLVQL